MVQVTLSEMLSCRERRAEMQKDMLKKCALPVLSFTMNIAGPIKTSPLIERGFNEGLFLLLSEIAEEKIREKTISFLKTGPEAFFSVDMSAAALKEICTEIEERNSLGRLFDMDVTDISGEKLSRENERGCIVCGKKGRGCAARRLHSAEEIFAATNKILCEHFLNADAEKIALIAKNSLIDEVSVTVKPGLVDRFSNGSHTDMCFETFVKSADALEPYFKECFLIGQRTQTQPPHSAFLLLKEAGINAEKEMYKATSGVNTHKGAIYSLGLLCGALGRLYNAENPMPETEQILSAASELCKEAVSKDLENAEGKTAGEKLYIEMKIKGIRGQAASGFPDVKNIALPTFKKALSEGKNKNDAAIICLLNLIANVEDTNLYKRGGKEGAEFAKKSAQSLLKEGICKEKLIEMDREFIRRNLSPGGSADLLALTLFLHGLK